MKLALISDVVYDQDNARSRRVVADAQAIHSAARRREFHDLHAGSRQPTTWPFPLISLDWKYRHERDHTE